MPKVVIYTTTYCGYCRAATRKLNKLGIEHEKIDVTGDREMRRKLAVMAEGRDTVPQIFIDGVPIGGYTDLVALEKSGELSRLLAEE